MIKAFGAWLLLSAALRAAEPSPLAWKEEWPRFRPAEYAATGVAAAGAAGLFYGVPAPTRPAWKGQVFYDRPARNALLVGSATARRRVTVLSDALVLPLMGYALLDGPLTTGLAGERDAALQLALINAETFAILNLLNFSITNVLPRARPAGAVCEASSHYDPGCVKSFWSGHTSNAFAAASLICVEHEALPLYGGGRADGAACAAALFVASAVGVTRITSNRHHASDVVTGAAVGAALGYMMPKLLHFKPRPAVRRLGRLIPSVGPGGGGLTYVKTW